VLDLAKLICSITGSNIEFVENPRKEAAKNDLSVSNASFLKLGLDPTKLSEGLLEEVSEIAKRFKDRANLSMIPCVSKW